MNETPQTHIDPSDSLRQEHGIAEDKVVVSHEITVVGTYWAFSKDQDEKVRRPYSETFELSPREKLLHKQNALSHILSDKSLAERLSKKDPEFRAIATHTIARHENVLAPIPETLATAKKKKRDGPVKQAAAAVKDSNSK